MGHFGGESSNGARELDAKWDPVGSDIFQLNPQPAASLASVVLFSTITTVGLLAFQ